MEAQPRLAASRSYAGDLVWALIKTKIRIK